jgi:hypothetical protein
LEALRINESEFVMDFFHDLAKLLEKEMESAGYVLPQSMSDELLVRGYLNLLHRLIPARVREVLQSSDLVCPEHLAAGYAEVKRKASTGEPLTPHQSRLLDDVEYTDPLLNDWGVHHLHLSTTLEADGFVTRTGPLLFARVTDDFFYAIQIYAHGAWSKQEIVEILHRNWPDSIKRYRLKGVTGLLTTHTDRDIKDLRQAGVQGLTQVEQSVYAPMGGGVTTSRVSLRVMQSLIDLRGNCQRLEGKTIELANEEASRGRPLPSGDFALVRSGKRALVMERSTKLELFSVNWLINRDLR